MNHSRASARGAKLTIVLSLLCLAFGGCGVGRDIGVTGVRLASSNQPGPSVPNLTKEQYPAELEKILQTIDRYYAHKDSKSIDIAQLREQFLPRLQRALDLNELNLILAELFALLHNGHANVYNWIAEHGVPAACGLVDGRPTITDMRNVPELSEAGVSLGWVIEQIDQQPAVDWLQAQFPLLSASTEQSLWQESAQRVFLRYDGQPEVRRYLLRGPAGQSVEVSIPLTLPVSVVWRALGRPGVTTRDLGEFGYIAINTMTNGVVEQFDQALLPMLSKSGLILDLRANGGGNSLNGNRIVQRLIQQDTQGWSEVIKPYHKLNYAGPLAVLVGPYTFSAAESFAFDLVDSGRATTIGEPTAGDSGGGPARFITDGGIQFRFPTRGVDYSASGLPMEGVGLQPQLHVRQSHDDLLVGRDTVLEAAKAKLIELIGVR